MVLFAAEDTDMFLVRSESTLVPPIFVAPAELGKMACLGANTLKMGFKDTREGSHSKHASPRNDRNLVWSCFLSPLPQLSVCCALQN